jgi:hypothetical protein
MTGSRSRNRGMRFDVFHMILRSKNAATIDFGTRDMSVDIDAARHH